MDLIRRNVGLLTFCLLTFVFTMGASALVGNVPAKPTSDDQSKARVTKGRASVVLLRSAPKRVVRSSSSSSGDRRSTWGRTSSRTGSRGNRSYRGGGLFGGK